MGPSILIEIRVSRDPCSYPPSPLVATARWLPPHDFGIPWLAVATLITLQRPLNLGGHRFPPVI